MKVVVSGSLPTWLDECGDAALSERLGSTTFARGEAYAQQRAVLTLTSIKDGQVLQASVRGSGRKTYQTVITHRAATDWSGHCSCPMQTDCKHVAAVLLTARRHLTPTPAPVGVGSWESQLSDVLHHEATPVEQAPLGLQFEITAPSTTHHPEFSPARPRLRLRPVIPGKNGRWIRTGVSWRDLDDDYGPVRGRPAHRQVLRAISLTFQSRGASSLSTHSDGTIPFDVLGPAAWGLLTDAQDAGIALLGPQPTVQVRVAKGPAEVVADLRRAAPEAAVVLTTGIRIPDEPELDLTQLTLLGSPPHGLFVWDTELLLLAAFEQPLTPGVVQLLKQPVVDIPAPELARFQSHYYPALRRQLTVESSDDTIAFPQIAPPRLVLDVHFGPEHRTELTWAFGYGLESALVRIPLRGSEEFAARDLPAERTLLDGLSELGDLDLLGGRLDPAGQLVLAQECALLDVDTALFVEHSLPLLQARDDIVVEITGTPAAYEQVVEAPLISVSARDSTEPLADWFDLAVNVSVGGHNVPIASLITALTRDQPHVMLESGAWFRLDRPELHALRRLIAEARALQDNDRGGLRLTAFQAGLWEELVSLGVVEHQSQRWAQQVGGLLGLDTMPQTDPPDGLLATLRPYQLEGFRWLSLLWDHQLGGVLADDMGLGKTLQTLAMAMRARAQGTLGGEAGPLLIVAPTSVVGTWGSEAARFCPELNVVLVTETERRRGVRLSELTPAADLVVTSYALLRLDEEVFREQTWSGLVLDEAQYVKNHQSQSYHCARRLPAPFKLAITGTPLENSLMDLWSMLSITAPGLFPNPQRFSELYRKPIESGAAPEQLDRLRRRIRPLMLRRTKEQVAPDLPPKVEQVLPVTLNPTHRRIYDKHFARERQRVLGLLDDLQRNRIAIFSSLTLLRQLSLDVSLVDKEQAVKVRSSKIDALLEQLAEVVDEGHRVLVFSQFTGFLSLVKARLDAEGIRYCYLDGRTRNRDRKIAEFTEGDAPVFLISLKAGGVGLTLTEADYVFVLDPWWNPATEAQAIDRTHRIGQTKTVMVYRLVATDTIEEKVVALQQRKRDLFERVVGDSAQEGAALTADDIRALFD